MTDTVDERTYDPSRGIDENNNPYLTWTFSVMTLVNGVDRGGMMGIDAHDGKAVG